MGRQLREKKSGDQSVQLSVPKKPVRYQKRSRVTREALILTASNLFQEKGISNTTVTDITVAAGLGYGTFYRHFDSLDDIVSAVAEATMRRMVSIVSEMLIDEVVFELAPVVCARAAVRYFSESPAVRGLLERPHVFVEEWHKAVTPFIAGMAVRASREAPQEFAVSVDHESTLRLGPWIVICELEQAISVGAALDVEEKMANLVTRLVALDDDRHREIVEKSRKIVDKAEALLKSH